MKQILKKSGLALAMLLISVFVMGHGVTNTGINGEVADQNGSTMPGFISGPAERVVCRLQKPQCYAFGPGSVSGN